MNTKVFRIITVFVAMILAWGTYTPGRAISDTALTSSQTVNIAYFYKPPNMDAASAAQNFDTMILTNGDDTYRDQLKASGFASTIPEYFRSEAIQDPGSCTAIPLNNQIAYKPGDFCSISRNHPDWFLLDSRGRRITVTAAGNYYRMDPGNAGWRDFFVSRVVESQNQDGWTALFLDNVEASLGKFFGNNPAKYPDEASYQAAVAGFLQYLDVNYSQKYDRPFFGNIIVLGSDDVWFNYLQYLDGALTERFAVDWDESSYLRADKWEDDLALMEKTQAQGKYAILVAPGYQNDLNRQNFAFASYLLISNGKVAFRYAKFSAYREAWLYDNYKVNLGSPLGPRYVSGGTWHRDFTKGCVTVDPGSHQATIEAVGGKCMPAAWTGGVVVQSDRNLVAVGRSHIGNEIASYNGFTSGSSSMYIPMLFNGAFGGSYNSAFYIQNVSSNGADITIKYYNSSGTLNCTEHDSIAPFASKGYWVPSQTCLPAGWVGGVTITSNQNIVAVGRPHIGNQITSYDGFAGGNGSPSVPMLFKNMWGSYNSAFYLQNVDAGNSANVTLRFYDADGNLVCTRNDTIPPLASLGYWLPKVSCSP